MRKFIGLKDTFTSDSSDPSRAKKVSEITKGSTYVEFKDDYFRSDSGCVFYVDGAIEEGEIALVPRTFIATKDVGINITGDGGVTTYVSHLTKGNFYKEINDNLFVSDSGLELDLRIYLETEAIQEFEPQDASIGKEEPKPALFKIKTFFDEVTETVVKKVRVAEMKNTYFRVSRSIYAVEFEYKKVIRDRRHDYWEVRVVRVKFEDNEIYTYKFVFNANCGLDTSNNFRAYNMPDWVKITLQDAFHPNGPDDPRTSDAFYKDYNNVINYLNNFIKRPSYEKKDTAALEELVRVIE